MKILDYKNLII